MRIIRNIGSKSSLACLVFISAVLFSADTCASIVVDGTRVIYQGSKNEVTVNVTNKNKAPVLIQSWIDRGDEQAAPEKISVPFVLTPPINRVESNNSQTIRISYTGVPALPTDKESVFWLNILEVPSKAKNSDGVKQKLNVVFRTRIKLFYRPEGLEGDSISAVDELHWRLNNSNVMVINNSKYNISLLNISYQGKGVNSEVKGKMIAPGESQTYPLKNTGSISNLSFSTVNDYGALVNHKAKN